MIIPKIELEQEDGMCVLYRLGCGYICAALRRSRSFNVQSMRKMKNHRTDINTFRWRMKLGQAPSLDHDSDGSGAPSIETKGKDDPHVSVGRLLIG